MKNEQLYKKTCDILFDAYFNDLLQHGNQCGCAVGNLVAANMGIKLMRGSQNCVMPVSFNDDDTLIAAQEGLDNNGTWYRLKTDPSVRIDNPYIFNVITKQIDSTGYSLENIFEIEKAFENAGYTENEDKYMFNGLCCVIEVLNKIHEVEEDTQTERFKNHYKTKFA